MMKYFSEMIKRIRGKIAVFTNHHGHFREPCMPWEKHWEEKTGRVADHCYNIQCKHTNELCGKAIVGAHVDVVDKPGEVYLLPLCRGCNNWRNTEEMEAWNEDLVMVPKELLVSED